MFSLKKLWSRVAAYAASPDPQIAAFNTLALVVACNQPFYPLYVWWLIGDDGWTSLWTFLSTPFFVAVPAATRRWPVAGRALLPLAGIGNTMLAEKAFGAASGVDAFLVACVVIALLGFKWAERAWIVALCGVAAVAFVVGRETLGQPLRVFTPAEYASFVNMNRVSAACLTLLAIYKLVAARRRAR
jgi:hypothetical protein